MSTPAFSSVLTPSYTAMELLQDESVARGYVYARAPIAELIAAAFDWEPTDGFLLKANYRDVVIFRDISGMATGTSEDPKWGVVRIGNSNFRVGSEAQVLAYLIARYHTFSQKEVGALLSSVKEV